MQNKEKPIIFSAPMVRAILDGTKTQTRRVINWPLRSKSNGACRRIFTERDIEDVREIVQSKLRHPHQMLSTGYRKGDRLWVRETWKTDHVWNDLKPSDIPDDQPILWTADEGASGVVPFEWGKTRTPIFMPKWAARIWLEVTDVRVERVQDIDRLDAKKEGFWPSKKNGLERWNGCIYGNAELAFRACWDDINKKRGYGWDKNPWVFVYEFRRIDHAK